MPLLTLNQVRLVLRIGLAHGQEMDNVRRLELLGVVGAGFGLRAVARELLNVVPVGGWAVRAPWPTRAREQSARPRCAISTRARPAAPVRPDLVLGSLQLKRR